MNKHYVKMVITPVGFELRSSVLTGSLTTTEIDVSNVEVEPYEAGFDIGTEHNDFQDLSFD